MKHNYIKVKTTDVIEDMTRYMSYAGQPQTVSPIKVTWPSGLKPTVHTFETGGWTYYMQPTSLNKNWLRAVERYASFGVRVYIERQ